MRTIEEYEARQTEIRSRVQEIDTEYAGRAFPDDARSEWDELNVELEENEKVIGELRARRDRVAEIAGNPGEGAVERPSFHTKRAGSITDGDVYDLSRYRSAANSPERETQLLRDGAMKAVETSQYPHEEAKREDTQAHIERLMSRFSADEDEAGVIQQSAFARRILATGSPTYKRAFGKALAGKPLSAEEQRALSLTAGEGGYAVPFVLDPTIIPTSNHVVNPIRRISRVETIAGANTWKGVSSGGITASRAGETTEATDNAPSLAQPEATVTKVQAFIPFSSEIGQDWGSLQTEMARLLQDAKDVEEATAFLTGSGSGDNPQGVVTGATGTVAAGTASFAVAHLYALEEALGPRFRTNARFIASRTQYNRIRQLDTNGGANLWKYLEEGLANDATGNTGARVLGYPAEEASTMATVLTAGTKVMVFGDFRYYLIVDRIGMQVELIPHLFGTTSNYPTGQRGIYAHWRNTGKVLAAAAFKASVTT